MLGSREKFTDRWRQDGLSGFVEQASDYFGVEVPCIVIDRGWPRLPDCECFCLFEFKPLTSPPNDFQSRLAVCLFTEELPTDLPKIIQQELTHLGWSSFAKDFDASL